MVLNALPRLIVVAGGSFLCSGVGIWSLLASLHSVDTRSLFTKSEWFSSRFIAGHCCGYKNQIDSKLRLSSLIILGFAF